MNTPLARVQGRGRIRAALLLSLILVPLSELRPQIIAGRVLDATSGVAVGTGFVVLVDTSGNEVARALSDEDGRYTLRAPSIGVYRLRSERIGYRAQESDPLGLLADSTFDYTLEVRALPVELSVVQVVAEDRCRVNPAQAAETAVIWEEIRKALAATAWDGTQELAYFRKYSYERHRSADWQQVVREEGRTVSGIARQPYQSLPAEQLAEDGYIVDREDGLYYALPDADVLLDDTFLATHCFRVTRDTARPGAVGLAFEPTDDRTVADVAGALWLEEATSQLQRLEVRYTNLPEGVVDPYAGGTVEFMQLPSGAWIVQRWEVRSPTIARRQADVPHVTIITVAKRGVGVRTIRARWSDGRSYPINIVLSDSVATSLPWHAPGWISFDGSEEIRLDPGDVFVLEYPEFFRVRRGIRRPP